MAGLEWLGGSLPALQEKRSKAVGLMVSQEPRGYIWRPRKARGDGEGPGCAGGGGGLCGQGAGPEAMQAGPDASDLPRVTREQEQGLGLGESFSTGFTCH